MLNNQRSQIYLAALLHDIGKFFQRADPNPYWGSNVLSATSKNLSSVICPQKKGLDGNNRPSHHHVIWTHEFFELDTVKKHFESLGLKVNPFDSNSETFDNLVNLSIYHHRPNTKLQAIIQMADHWASGLDRTKRENEEIDPKNFKEVGLFSVFSQIDGEDKKDFFVTMLPQKLEEQNVMPKSTEELHYSELWSKFIMGLDIIPKAGNGHIKAFTESLLFLLKKFTSCLPASTFKMDLPSVSLYDHLRVTAAIADGLFAYAEAWGFDEVFEFQTGTRNFLKLKKAHEQPLLLACVDLSGIQTFIYNISGSRAAKSLKGRSFYLQLLIDTILDRLILDNNLTLGHVLYSSGGKAYILMPNTLDVKTRFRELHQEVIENVRKEHGLTLYVCMEFVPFGYDQSLKVVYERTHAESIGELWKVLGEKTGKQKQRRYEDLFNIRFDEFFQPEQIKFSGKICSVTGKILTDGFEHINKESLAEEPVFVSKEVADLIELGKRLKDADFVITFSGTQKTPDFKRAKGIEPLGLGIYKYLFDQKDLTEDDADFRKITSFDFCRVQYINETGFESVSKLKGQGASYGYLFYGGNKQAEKESRGSKYSEEKQYDELAKGEGFDRLGILRMDVDNLGDLFIRRIPKDQRNLATYATLSSQLDLFFSGYLNTIRKKDIYKNHVNVLYSGGDDVFAIGRWKEIVEFALEIREDFRKFVGGRNDITLSAGISLVGGKYPIAKAADLAGEAEASAKRYGMDNGKAKKDALTFLEISFSWKQMEEVRSQKDEFVSLYNNGEITKSLLQKLMLYYLQKEAKPKDFSYIWEAAYFLKRYTVKEGSRAEGLKERLMRELVEKSAMTNILEQTALAARWAELEIRTIKSR